MNDDDAATTTTAPAAALPTFSLREVQLRKGDSCNSLSFGVPPRASVLLRVLHPKAHAYEEKDERWMHLLQAVAVVPSRKVETLEKLVQLALQLLPSLAWKRRFEASVRAHLATLGDAREDFAKRALAGLHIKDRVAQFLREWLADPIEGVVLWQDHVVAGLRLDDLVATPVGAGYLRGYRRADHVCIVLYPWGHGFIQLQDVQRLAQAITAQRQRKRARNEFLALEHQRLFEDVESLLENYPSPPPPSTADGGDNSNDNASAARVKLTPEGVNIHEYTELLASLQDDEALDEDVVQHDLGFVRRVQALTAKTREQQQRHALAHTESSETAAHGDMDVDGGDGEQVQDAGDRDDAMGDDDDGELPQRAVAQGHI